MTAQQTLGAQAMNQMNHQPVNEGLVMDVPGEAGTIFGRMGLGKEMLPRFIKIKIRKIRVE